MADPIRLSFSNNTSGVSSTLKYPSELFAGEQDGPTDYVKFEFFKYKPPFDFNSTQTPLVDAQGKQVNAENTSTSAIYNNSSLFLEPTNLPVKKIFMYMPEDIGAQYQSDWGGKGFTNVAADILRTTGAITQGNTGGAAQAVASAIKGAAQRFPSLGADAIAQAMNSLPGGIGGDVGMQDVLAGMGGVILNPNVELLFTGFKLRDFGLKFKMVPRKESDAKIIRNIITTFKKASLPDLGGLPQDFVSKSLAFFSGPASGQNGQQTDYNRNYIGVPNLCLVTFMHGANAHPYLSQYKTAAITSVEVNYTPDGSYSVHAGKEPSPVAYELSLGFSETKLVYQDDISYGGPTF